MSSTFALADLPSNGNPMPEPTIKLRSYRGGDAEAFRLLNEAWIEKYFGLEDADRKILNDPEGYVLAKGGHIFFATAAGAPIGCCGLMPIAPGEYEVVKMAVAEEWQGRGIGRRVLEYTVEQARALGAKRLYLETNNTLKNAVHLYEALGFQHLPPKQSPYVRANVFMEMWF
ncbi:GNAT family N-acetyltransferase [Edaphobacter flagellatus]|uniref:GNAT family N-acetyltransferase n=1 Tax=Edaphobacter flagellatus TaxID=1933044 RepID=UPI0021B3B240|nr:GNAT family N-acetyltransferase [Edaphobacter flagellatus]